MTTETTSQTPDAAEAFAAMHQLVGELTDLLETLPYVLSKDGVINAIKTLIAEHESGRDGAAHDEQTEDDTPNAALDAIDRLREDVLDALNRWMEHLDAAKREAAEWPALAAGALTHYFLSGDTVGDVQRDPLLWSVKGGEPDPGWRFDTFFGLEYFTLDDARRHIAAVERQINCALHNIDHLARERTEELAASYAQGPGAYIVKRVKEAHRQLNEQLGEEPCECLHSMGTLNIAWDATLTPVKLDFMPKKMEGWGRRIYDLGSDELGGCERALSSVAEQALAAAVGDLKRRFERQVMDYAANEIVRYLNRFNECTLGMKHVLLERMGLKVV